MNAQRRTLAALTAATFLTAFTWVSPARAADAPDHAAIRETLRRYEQALNQADTRAVAQLYTDDGVQMAPDAPVAVGRDALTAAYDGTFKAISVKLHFVVDEIQPLGSHAALLRSHSTGTLKVNGKEQAPAPVAFKELFVLRKQPDGQWKFSHYSFSAMPAVR